MSGVADVILRLEAITEELGDLAVDKLRESLESGNLSLAEEERRINRARRSVEKAAGILAGMPTTDNDD